MRHPGQVSEWLALAAKHPRTFYGLLARRALGIALPFDFTPRALSPKPLARLLALPGAGRAFALLQVGERERAETELLGLDRIDDAEMAEAFLVLLDRARFPRLAFRLAQRLFKSDETWSAERLDASLYPIPPWQPKGGYIVDRALVYALMRQESAFNPRAKSPDGARGLMQLMPATAGFVDRSRRYRGKRRRELFQPELNIDLGQRYLAYLLDHKTVRGDLFRLTTAYNGGPGNLGKWQRRMDYEGDPLLFIESLPSRETRLFIERVLSNLWIYRARLNQPAPSLDAIVVGNWPTYAALDGGEREGLTQEASRHVAD